MPVNLSFVCVCACVQLMLKTPPSDANGTEGSETGSTFSASWHPLESHQPEERERGRLKVVCYCDSARNACDTFRLCVCVCS